MSGNVASDSGSKSGNQCVTLWVGDALGPVERACMMSVLRQGHELALYCYRKPSGIPDRVELRDASVILAQSKVFFGSRGSIAPFSDWFRYELQRHGLGTWIDTDMYLLRPLDRRAETILGEEKPGIINNAVFRLPSNSPLLDRLLELFERRKTPPGIHWRAYIRSRVRELLGPHAHLERLPWGATGPLAVTAYAKKLGLADAALPSDCFYPVPWDRAEWIIDPRASLETLITSRTVGVHLWNECIKTVKNEPAPKGSFLERLHRESGL